MLLIEGEKLGLLEEDHKMQVPQEQPADLGRPTPAQLEVGDRSPAQIKLQHRLDVIGWAWGQKNGRVRSKGISSNQIKQATVF